MVEWKVKIPLSYEQQNTMPIDRSKVEALKFIAEELEAIRKQLEQLNKTLGAPK